MVAAADMVVLVLVPDMVVLVPVPADMAVLGLVPVTDMAGFGPGP